MTAHCAQGCPLCGERERVAVHAAAAQPVLLNRLHDARDEALRAPRVSVSFVGCPACGFVYNESFDPDAISYAPGYVNDQSCSGRFCEHLDEILERLALSVVGRPGSIVEVGCGQGDFLRALAAAAGRSAVGFDPACRGEVVDDLDVRFVPRSFGPDDADALAGGTPPPCLLCCRHVLEHLPDPLAMLRLFRAATAPSDAPIYLEVPTFRWIAEHGAFFDLFNEHCSLFDPGSMRRALVRAGLTPCRIEPVFGGQYLAVEAVPGSDGDASPAPRVRHEPFRTIAGRLLAERERVARTIDEHLRRGPVTIWGAGAKAVCLVTGLGLDHRRLPFLVDVNHAKQEHFVPITGQQVVAPEALPALIGDAGADATILVVNPNYADEIRDRLALLGLRASLVVMSEKDHRAVHR